MSADERSEALRWLAYAEEDLRAAEILQREGASPRQACFLAQQAAEKALKGVLVRLGIEFPKTHDLMALRGLLPEPLAEMPGDEELAELTQWASQVRYPGDFPEPSMKDAERALHAAAQLVNAAAGPLGA